jgi:hypothetical protein
MPQKPKSLLIRGAAEVLIIATGIILAISAESWWQDRGDRLLESRHLAALHDDLVASLALIYEVEADQEAQLNYLSLLLRSDVTDARPEELRLWLDDGVFDIWTYRPQLAALEDLESSGQMRLIRNAEIRRALAALRQKVDRFDGVQDDMIASQQALIDQYLVDNVNLVGVLVETEDDRAPLIATETLQSQPFRSRVAFKLGLRRLVGNSLREMRQEFERSLDLLELELDAQSAR